MQFLKEDDGIYFDEQELNSLNAIANMIKNNGGKVLYSLKEIANYVNTPKWLWLKIYVLQLWRVKHCWQRIRIACGHHYDWQDYENINVY